MAAMLIEAPAVEPVSLAEGKAYLKLEGSEEDAILSRLMIAARVQVERIGGLALIRQRWWVSLDRWPGKPDIELPIAPVSEIHSLKVLGEDDAAATIDPAHYFADLASSPQRLVLRGSRQWPPPGRSAAGIEIELAAGFGEAPEDVPQGLRQAILLLGGHWYEHRLAVEEEGRLQEVPLAVRTLVHPYRRVRL
ncbi:MAG: head-tail connector protein [Candidatus Rokubacteria bacterium]|nr:head-tail connector protein [Candidatus Rokubacteria bacterium]